MPKLVLMPPQTGQSRDWGRRLAAALPGYRVLVPETGEEAAREIADADAAYGRIPPEALRRAVRLRWLQSPQAAPPAGFYYPALIDHPVVVCNPRGVFNDHIAQHILMFVLALARGLPDYAGAQQERRWDPDARRTPYLELSQATALIVGVGGIGQETARVLHTFGTRLIGVDQRWDYPLPYLERHTAEGLDALLPEADFVIVTVPHTPETEGMWHAGRFSLMKRTAFFINIGRGLTTKLDDLARAVSSGTIAGCALDVFETEPLPADHPLWTMPGVLLTPHVAVVGADNVSERMFDLLLDNARRFESGRPLHNVVDKRLWH